MSMDSYNAQAETLFDQIKDCLVEETTDIGRKKP